MGYLTQVQIAYEMFKQWAAKVFGGGVHFPTAPGHQVGWVK